MDIAEWKIHVLIEVGAIPLSILEYESPLDVAVRLEAIAKELRQFYGEEGAIAPSTRPEINQLRGL